MSAQVPTEEFREFFYDQVARLGKALSSGPRLVLLNILCQGERSVDVLADTAQLTVANTSRHLQTLKSAGLVEARRDGNRILYRVSDLEVVRFFGSMKDLAASQLAQVQRAMADLCSGDTRLQPVGRSELLELVGSCEAIVLDVRPHAEYAQGHIPTAICMPLDVLKDRLHELPRDKAIVAVCRGRYCVLADQAVLILRQAGLSARRAEDGVVQWRLDGLELAVPPA